MPVSIFGISVSGLLSNQAALNTTSHNIANANTEGYSRQRVSQSPQLPEFIGGNYFGAGVEVGQVTRIFDQTHQLEIRAATATFNELESYLAQADRVDSLLADSNNGLDQSLQSFFEAVHGVVNDPASVSARQVMLGQAEGLVSRFDSIHTQLDAQITQVNTNIDSVAKEITALGAAVATLNNQISGSAGNPPPDLLDRRDVAIGRISELIAVQTTQQTDGSMNVFIGSGQSLVVGSLSNSLVATPDTQNPRAMSLSLEAGSSSIEITENLQGGQLGGLLKVVDEIINPAFNTLGRVAISVADLFNTQNGLGMDLNNELGGNLFTDINDPTIASARVSDDANNTGNVDLSISIDDPSLLGNSDFTLFIQGGNYQLVDQTTNTTIATFAPPGVLPDTVQIASRGISINFLSGAAINGDSFEIQPSRNFSSEFSVEISSAEEIAAASPVRGEQLLSNIGSGTITNISVTDTSTVQFTGVPNDLNPPIRIEFDSPPGVPGEFSIYDISGGAPVLIAGGIAGYVPGEENNMLALAGAPFNAYGYEVTLNGDPQPGDAFDINYNNNGSGNNENAALFAELQQFSGLDNGGATFQQAFSRIIASVGVNTQSTQIKRDAAESIMFQTHERRENLSGVNLDEEAANLLKFQQAYEASAQVISVARTLFQTVLDSVR
ncbi:MAG: flagellar hook-associated protein FlgK [Kangiellaceae bacterium]|nr:flagellar hook-associated protein FlgK [Kangiellaceae bacterium]